MTVSTVKIRSIFNLVNFKISRIIFAFLSVNSKITSNAYALLNWHFDVKGRRALFGILASLNFFWQRWNGFIARKSMCKLSGVRLWVSSKDFLKDSGRSSQTANLQLKVISKSLSSSTLKLESGLHKVEKSPSTETIEKFKVIFTKFSVSTIKTLSI